MGALPTVEEVNTTDTGSRGKHMKCHKGAEPVWVKATLA